MRVELFDGVKQQCQWSDINGLSNYLDEVWQARPLLSTGEDEDERRGTTQKFFKLEDNSIKATKYVGFVQYGDLRINVYPRVFHEHPCFDATLAINHVLKWLSYGRRIHFPFNEVPLHLENCDDWLEALIYLFGNYTLDILSSSPHFAYQEVTEEMAFMRGRIAMQPYIAQNLAKGRHHLVHCTYEPFLYDNIFNRIVKHTCRLLASVTRNTPNKHLLSDILFLLDEVTDAYCSSEDCAKVAVNRLYPEIGVITNMCAAFLSNCVYNEGTANRQNLCILLPMEVIYEQYIAGFLKVNFPELNAKPQASGEYVAKTGDNFTKDVFQMRHDILLPGKLIIDTKYKFRYQSDDNKGAVSQNDVYQMVTYLYKRNIKEGLLLYPMHFNNIANNEKQHFKINDLYIKACSVDITVTEMINFEEGQKLKFKSFLS